MLCLLFWSWINEFEKAETYPLICFAACILVDEIVLSMSRVADIA